MFSEGRKWRNDGVGDGVMGWDGVEVRMMTMRDGVRLGSGGRGVGRGRGSCRGGAKQRTFS